MKIKSVQSIIIIFISISSILSAQSIKTESTSNLNSNWVYLGLQGERILNIAID